MEAVAWRKLEEATADMVKGLGSLFKELKNNGFSQSQAFIMTKDYMILVVGDALRRANIGGKDDQPDKS